MEDLSKKTLYVIDGNDISASNHVFNWNPPSSKSNFIKRLVHKVFNIKEKKSTMEVAKDEAKVLIDKYDVKEDEAIHVLMQNVYFQKLQNNIDKFLSTKNVQSIKIP